MSGLVKKVAKIAIPAAIAYATGGAGFALPGLSAATTSAIGSVASSVLSGGLGGGGSSKPKSDPAVLAAQQRQDALLKQQSAATTRLQVQTDKQEATLSGQMAAQRRAISARRRGRNSLAFSGSTSTSGLANTLGGV